MKLKCICICYYWNILFKHSGTATFETTDHNAKKIILIMLPNDDRHACHNTNIVSKIELICIKIYWLKHNNFYFVHIMSTQFTSQSDTFLVLEYIKWQNFENIITRAYWEACSYFSHPITPNLPPRFINTIGKSSQCWRQSHLSPMPLRSSLLWIQGLIQYLMWSILFPFPLFCINRIIPNLVFSNPFFCLSQKF